MTKTNEILEKYQATNDSVTNVIGFTSEAFEQFVADSEAAVKTATVKGVIIGAASTGLVSLGVWGVNKFVKGRKPKKVKKKVDKGNLEGVEVNTIEPDEIEVIDKKPVKKVSKEDKEQLAKIIDEVKEAEKKGTRKR